MNIYPLTPQKRLDQRNSPKSIRFNLMHIDKLVSRQSSKASPTSNQSLIHHIRNRGMLSSIRKYYKQISPTKTKLVVQYKKTNKTQPVRQNCYLSAPKKNQKTYVLKKRLSTQCTNYRQSLETNDTRQIMQNVKMSQINPEIGITIRLPKRNKRVTISKLLEQKHQKKRDYQFSKLSRTNIIPDYLIFSKRQSQNQQKRLIKNISQKIYSQYRVSPNFQSPKN